MTAEISIVDVGREGQGVGVDESSNLYFVRGVIPGDVALVEFEGHRRYRDAKLIKIISPSADRIDPVCAYFLDCGGCDWLQWEYSKQLKAKERLVQHIVGRSEWLPLQWEPIIGAKQTLHYRNRAQLRKNGSKVGFFRRDSHEVVDVKECALVVPKINEVIEKLRRDAPSPATEKYEVSLLPSGDVAVQRNVAHGFSGFEQIHSGQNEVLREQVSKSLAAGGDAVKIIELFCGSGNLTFHYAKAGQSILAVDGNAQSIENGQTQHLSTIQRDAKADIKFACDWVDKKLADKYPEYFGECDTLIVDPPRSGIGSQTLKSLVGPSIRRLIYISCSALSFSEDIQPLKEMGFIFRRATPIDMFPQTRHVELVSLFTRS